MNLICHSEMIAHFLLWNRIFKWYLLTRNTWYPSVPPPGTSTLLPAPIIRNLNIQRMKKKLKKKKRNNNNTRMKCEMATTNARTKEEKKTIKWQHTNSKIQLFLLRFYNIFILFQIAESVLNSAIIELLKHQIYSTTQQWTISSKQYE